MDVGSMDVGSMDVGSMDVGSMDVGSMDVVWGAGAQAADPRPNTEEPTPRPDSRSRWARTASSRA